MTDRRDPRARGRSHGVRHRDAIAANVAAFRAAAAAAGWDERALERAAGDIRRSLPPEDTAELDAIGDAAGISPGAHLAYALTAHVVAPEECTVAAAVGAAAGSGATVLFKNSDKIGADSLTGAGYHRFKEINVVTDLETPEGLRVVGVVSAGTTSYKMGANDAGVAVASNIARTTGLRTRRRSLDDLLALDRGQILARALCFTSAWEAAEWTLRTLETRPMATPGIVHVAAADHMYVVEGSDDRTALETVRDRILVRANGFVLLDELNDPEDSSSPARRARALTMLAPLVGAITPTDLRRVSSDHANGPGLNSICRHSDDHREETTLSAMIVGFERAGGSAATTVEIALGKPCRSWGSPDASVRIDLGSDRPIPQRFTDGTAWVEAYREDPAGPSSDPSTTDGP